MKTIEEPENIIFSKETDTLEENKFFIEPWKVLIVDDEEDIHTITELALKDYNFKDRKIKLFKAFSSIQAKDILAKEKDIALILLDVVMEQDTAGLTLINYIRNDLNNRMVRIVIRTGQPGKAPEFTCCIKIPFI